MNYHAKIANNKHNNDYNVNDQAKMIILAQKIIKTI